MTSYITIGRGFSLVGHAHARAIATREQQVKSEVVRNRTHRQSGLGSIAIQLLRIRQMVRDGLTEK